MTTYSRAGKPGTVPTWLWPRDGHVYFTTKRDSLKARRIRDGGRVTVHVGAKDGPAFEGRAEWVDDRPDLEDALLRDYRGSTGSRCRSSWAAISEKASRERPAS